jgi:hypothetical protein
MERNDTSQVNNECAVGSLDRSQASTAAMSTVSTVADAAANQATLAATGVPGPVVLQCRRPPCRDRQGALSVDLL